jgi:hypothetical protein
MSRTDRPACERVRRALDAIIASEAFARSERLRSFLSYIVENELSGKAAQLKGYTIGIDVFGRPPGFDAGNDPLVRVQAGKLRKLLEQYYETEGAADRLRIRVPLGSYVPEYSAAEDEPETAGKAPHTPPSTVRPLRQKPAVRRSWLPAPVSSPLALFSLLPLFFLAPSIYPDASSTAIAKAQLVLSVQNKLAGRVQALPSLHIMQCWPSGGECNALARAIAGSAGYHRTVHLVDSRDAAEPHALSYAIRIESQPNGQGIYARLVHQPSGTTVFTRHFSREQLRGEGGIAYEAVTFTARALTATGPLYRHAMRTGVASNLMECLAQGEQDPPRATPVAGEPAACSHLPAALADVSPEEGPDITLTR